MPAITVADLSNAKADVDFIEEIATSDNASALDRFGNSKMTLAGAIATIASINIRGAWTPSTFYAAKDVVSVSGDYYIAFAPHTSTSTFAADQNAYWRLYGPQRPFQTERQTATAGQTLVNFNALTYSVGIGSLFMFVDGFFVEFSETSNTSATLAQPLTAGAQIVAIAGAPLNSTVVGDSALLSFTPAGAGAVTFPGQTKLREAYSIQDRGAVSGVDCAAAVAAESTVARDIVFPPGTWSAATTPAITGIGALRAGPDAVLSGAGLLALGITPSALYQTIQQNTNPTDYATQYFRRNTTHSGGSVSNTAACLRVDTFVNNAAATNQEWNFIASLQNGAAGSFNVAAFIQGNKNSTGATWAAVIEATDTTAIANPANALIGLEVDARSNGTDSLGNRIAIDVVCTRFNTSGASTETSYGIRIQTNGEGVNSLVKIGYGFGNAARANVGFDTSNATILQSAFRMAQSQTIGFNASGSKQMSYDGTGIRYSQDSGASTTFRFNDAGTLQIGANNIVGPRVTGWGAATNGSKVALNGATATLPQTSAALAQLIADLTAHGLIGA